MSPFDLPPWDQLGAFGTLKETWFNGVAANTLLAPADPKRALLVIVSSVNTPLFVTTYNGATTQQGFILSQYAPAIILTSKQHGPLVSTAWFVGSVAGFAGTVFSADAMYWDEPNSPGLKAIAHGQAPPPSQIVSTTPGRTGKSLLDYWRKLTGRGS